MLKKIAVLGFLFCVGNTSFALDCSDDNVGERGWNSGNSSGKSLFNLGWKHLNQDGNGCNKISELSNSLLEGELEKPSSEDSDFVACFYYGFSEALVREIENKYKKCGQECQNDGEAVGELIGRLACKVSKKIGNIFLNSSYFVLPEMKFCEVNMYHGCGFSMVSEMEKNGCERYLTDDFQMYKKKACFEPTHEKNSYDINNFEENRFQSASQLDQKSLDAYLYEI